MFQAGAVRQGRAYEQAVADHLTAFGWLVLCRRWVEPTLGVEIDIVAADRDSATWWIECKGSWESASGRNGLARTDSTKKLIANAWLLSTLPDRRPYMVVSSDRPTGSGATWLAKAVEAGLIDRVQIVPVL